MNALILKPIREVQLWILRRSEVARFEGIILADPRSPGERNPHFADLLLAALSLVKETDLRRFERVRRRLKWIVNGPPLYGAGAEYEHQLQACTINLREPSPEYPREHVIAWYARILVHEATHGEIAARGILYTPKLRSRIERLCVHEEQRFVADLGRTQPELARWLYREFDASNWTRSWNVTRTQCLVAGVRRLLQVDRQA